MATDNNRTVAQHGAKENGQPLDANDRFDWLSKLSRSRRGRP